MTKKLLTSYQDDWKLLSDWLTKNGIEVTVREFPGAKITAKQVCKRLAQGFLFIEIANLKSESKSR